MTSAAVSLLGNIRLWVEEEEAGTRTNDLCRSRWPGTLKGTLRSCEDTFEDLLWFALCFMCIGALGASSCEGGEAERGRERERRQAGGERTKPTWETIFQNKRSCWWERKMCLFRHGAVCNEGLGLTTVNCSWNSSCVIVMLKVKLTTQTCWSRHSLRLLCHKPQKSHQPSWDSLWTLSRHLSALSTHVVQTEELQSKLL